MDKITILVVEDTYSSYLCLYYLLRDNYNVLHACNGQECLDMVEKQVPDIILMDVKMPIMNGITALEQLRPKYPNLPIIMQSAYALREDIEDAMKRGATSYLTKPIYKNTLYQTIEDCLNVSKN